MSSESVSAADGAYSDVLGEPVMVPNPLITARQAAAILGLTTDEVYRLATAGIVETHAVDHKDRSYRLDDVKALAEPITVHEAAVILGPQDRSGPRPHRSRRARNHRSAASPDTPRRRRAPRSMEAPTAGAGG